MRIIQTVFGESVRTATHCFFKSSNTSSVVATKGKSWPSSHDKREIKSTHVVVRGLALYVMFMICSKPYTPTGIGGLYIYAGLYPYVTTYMHAYVIYIHRRIYIYIYSLYVTPICLGRWTFEIAVLFSSTVKQIIEFLFSQGLRSRTRETRRGNGQ